jgi:acyl dehydratase
MTAVYAPVCPRFEDVDVGQELAPLVRGPLLPPHLMRWSASIENWHRIHYDQPFTVGHEGLPGLLINGSWKQHFILQLLRRWAGTTGWVWRAEFQFRGMNLVGETLTAWGRVAELIPADAAGLARVELGIRNERDVESTPGTALVVLPRRGGPPLPADRAAFLDRLGPALAATN